MYIKNDIMETLKNTIALLDELIDQDNPDHIQGLKNFTEAVDHLTARNNKVKKDAKEYIYKRRAIDPSFGQKKK